MDQEIYLIGFNHRTADVDLREKFALQNCCPVRQGLVRPDGPVNEALLLSTCNRVEILAVGDRTGDIKRSVLSFWEKACGQPAMHLAPSLYTHTGLDAVRHLFTVASSLDSMVLGEPQILGQLKDAYRDALKSGSAKVIVNRLLHKSFSVAKRVRSETRISSSAVSVSYAAVELAKQIFGDLSTQSAMLVGAGEMAELAAKHLQGQGIERILVANRTFSRGKEMADKVSGKAVLFEELMERLAEVDIVITSTGAVEPIIRARDVKAVLKKRRQRPMFFIDIAVPRDIDPDVNNLDNVYLYDIDDLREVVEGNLAQRREEALKGEMIIEEEVDKFGEWLSSLELHPTIKDLLNQAEEIADRELRKSFKNLGEHDSPEVRQTMEILAHSLCRKLYHQPIVFLKRRSREEGSSRQFIHMARRIFNLDQDEIPENAHKDRKKKN